MTTKIIKSLNKGIINMYKIIITIFAVLLLCSVVAAQDTTEVEKKYKLLVGSGASISQDWETSTLNSIAVSANTDTKGTIGMFLPDESFIVYERSTPEDGEEALKVSSGSLMGIWNIREGRLTPFISLSETFMHTSSSLTASDNTLNTNLGVGAYFEITETLGLYTNNVFETGKLSTFKGFIGVYLAR